MCFSETASFTASALLLSAGLSCTYQAIKKNRNYLLFANVPTFFALQQFIEGMIWYQLTNINAQFNVSYWSSMYLFFAFAFWPVYVPLAVYCIETVTLKKKLFFSFIVAGLIFSLSLYLPLVLHYIQLKTSIHKYSINYALDLSYFDLSSYVLCYASIIVLPLFISSDKHIKVFGIFVFLSLVISDLLYQLTLTSVWCFFAAVLSLSIIYILMKCSGNQRNIRSKELRY